VRIGTVPDVPVSEVTVSLAIKPEEATGNKR